MKKVLTLLIVLGLTSVSSASFLISVNGQVDYPDTAIELLPSDHAVIDIHHLGGAVAPMTIALFADGPGTLAVTDDSWSWKVDEGGALYNLEGGDLQAWRDGLAGMGYLAVTSVVQIELKDVVDPFDAMPEGLVADLIDFHCDGEGDVTLAVMDLNTFEIYDEAVIHQVPEPMTMALLGLGGLALIRRRR